MGVASHIRELVACPRCKSTTLIWHEDRVECSTCGRRFAIDGGTPLLLAHEERPSISASDVGLLDRLPARMRPLAERGRPFVRPLLAHRSRASRDLTPAFVRSFPDAAALLNIGAGGSDYGRNVLSLDIAPAAGIHVVGLAEALPFRDGVFDGVVFQAVLEHVRNASAALNEIARVLRPGGSVFVEVPFIQGYHAAPADYRRFTVNGLRAELSDHGFTVDEAGVAVGPASAMAWIAAEYLALLLSGRSARAYRVMRVFTTWLTWPVKWTDAWLDRHEMAHVVASGVWAKGVRTPPLAG
jgi:SAM-dependent methyltransferase